MRKYIIGLIFGLVALLAVFTWQRRSDEGWGFPRRWPPRGTATFSASSTNAAEIIRADFNSDRLEDVAVAETDPLGRHRISIYLRRPGNDPQRQFVKIGHIMNPGEFSASAMMSLEGDNFRDLIVILSYSDGRKEMVRYRTEGDTYIERSRERL